MALGSFPLALRGAELLVLDKLEAGSKFTWCRYGTATVQLLCSCLCFCFRCFPAPVAVSQCYSCCFLRVLLFPFCGYLTTALGPAHLRVVASGLCCLALTVHLLLPQPFLWHVLPSPAHHLPANSLTSPAGAGLEIAVESSSFKRWWFPPTCLAFALSSFYCWIARWRSSVHKFLFGVGLLYPSVLYFGLSFEGSMLDSTNTCFCLQTIMLAEGSQGLCVAQASEFGGVICCDYMLPATESEQTLSLFSQMHESLFCSLPHLALYDAAVHHAPGHTNLLFSVFSFEVLFILGCHSLILLGQHGSPLRQNPVLRGDLISQLAGGDAGGTFCLLQSA